MWHITNLKYIFRNHLLERRYHPRNTANKWDKKLTIPPLEIRPPNKRSIESDTAVESRRKTEFTFTFSLKTNHGYGILGSRAFTEFYEKKEMQSTIKEKERKSCCKGKFDSLQFWIQWWDMHNNALWNSKATYWVQKNLTILHRFQWYWFFLVLQTHTHVIANFKLCSIGKKEDRLSTTTQ